VSDQRCGFGLVEHVDGCTAPARHRIILTARDVEAFACDEHIAEAERIADERGDAFAVLPIDPPVTFTREQRDVIADSGT